MKKTAILLLIASAMLILASCSKNKPALAENTGEETTEVVVATSAQAEPTTEPPVSDDEPSLDGIATAFLDSIKAGDYKKVAELLHGGDDEYRFIAGVKLDYRIVETVKDEDGWRGVYKVKFNVAKGDGQYFKRGESGWTLIVEPIHIDGPIILFRPSDKSNLEDKREDKGYIFCYEFTNELGICQTTSDFNAAIKEDPENLWTLHALVHFYAKTSGYGFGTPAPLHADVLEKYIRETTGITDVDYTDGGRLTAKTDFWNDVCFAHGGGWLFWAPESRSYNKGTGVYTDVLNYYIDAALFVVAKTVAYQYTQNSDGTYRMRSLKVLYDSGYDMAGNSV